MNIQDALLEEDVRDASRHDYLRVSQDDLLRLLISVLATTQTMTNFTALSVNNDF